MKQITKLGISKIKALGLENVEGVENSKNKSLSIDYVSCKSKGISIILTFEIKARGLESQETKGYINVFRGDVKQNIFNESVITPVDLNPNGERKVDVEVSLSFADNEFYKTKKYYRASVFIENTNIGALSYGFNIKLNYKISTQPDRKLSSGDLIEMGVPTKIANEYISALNSTFDEYQINTSLRKISFLGQVFSETEAFRIKSESGKSDSDYGGFKGRGCMQLTLKPNYVAYEEYKKKDDPNIDFTSNTANKDKINELPYYLDSGGWFWSIKTELNDDSDRNDFIYIAYRVNGGFNHFEKRVDYYKKAAKVLDKNYQDPQFNLKDSYCYNIPKASFGWALWHDPYFPSHKYKGVTRDSNIAKQSYKRFLELHIKAGSPKLPTDGWYGIKDIISFVKQRLNLL